MTLIVPLAGSMVAGPLGLAHLPRLWQKALLKSAGRLPPDYKSGTGGFDTALTRGIGVDLQEIVQFLHVLPSYEETEAWVRANATNLEGIPETSDYLTQREMPAERAAAMRALCGITDASFGRNAFLNQIDDLTTLHAFLIAHRDRLESPVVPAVSSSAYGPLGLMHLPRLWTKAVVKGAGGLPEGYHADSEALNERLADWIGMDHDASMHYLTAELPSYMAYERWVCEHAAALDTQTIARWNDIIGSVEATANAVLKTDLLDWKLFHEEVVACKGAVVN